MIRPQIVTLALFGLLTLGLLGCTTASEPALEQSASSKPTANATSRPVTAAPGDSEATPELSGEAPLVGRVEKTPEEWRALLTREQFDVTRKQGTERPFTGQYWNEQRSGSYLCVCCKNELFHSDTKFKSGTGWPSFYQPIAPGHVNEIADNSHGWNRTEVTCARCDAHLGHVFTDGPQPTGLRFCINSASLTLREE